MVICIFGESCTGKSTIADALKEKINAKVYTGKDYVKLAKNEYEAKQIFMELLKAHVNSSDAIIYVITEKEHLALLPEGTIRVLVTAELDTIKARFAKRMNGNLPAPVAAGLEKKHGIFNNEQHHLLIKGNDESIDSICDKLLLCCKEQSKASYY